MLYNNNRSSVLFIFLFVFLFSSTLYSAPPAPNNQVKVVIFNILAPCWANPEIYPATAAAYLDKIYRRGKIINFLKSKPTADVFALQEVTAVEFGFIRDALKKDYVAYQSFHSPSYWANWITVNPPWEPNGNAILLKKTKFTSIVFQDVALTDDGNHAAYIQATHVGTNKKMRIASIHLDSDYPYNRERELKALFNIMPIQNNVTDIVAGDFNIEINNANLQQDIVKAKFVSILSALGITDVTSPYSQSYYKHAIFGVIDVILVRNGQPVDGSVINFGLFQTYPTPAQEDARVTANMQISGSDHFPVEGTILLNP